MKIFSANQLPVQLRRCSIEQLFVRGMLPDDEDQPTLAVVGTRRCSQESIAVTRTLVEPVARAGVVVISGLAEGIDTAAHEGALAVGGTTVAVLGTGVDADSIYPQRNQPLAERIINAGGGVCSEYPPGTPGYRSNFPDRNRIIAALADLVLVVEAPARSGALITAKHADSYGIPTAGVPGSLHDPRCAGNNALLERGAEAVASPQRLAALLSVDLDIVRNRYTPATAVECAIIACAGQEPVSVDTIAGAVDVPIPEILATITHLEHTGIIRDTGGKRYVVASNVEIDDKR